jgi:hypothetical protein
MEMQRHTHDEQLAAKSYMKDAPPSDVKDKVERYWPNNYVHQKNQYDREIN